MKIKNLLLLTLAAPLLLGGCNTEVTPTPSGEGEDPSGEPSGDPSGEGEKTEDKSLVDEGQTNGFPIDKVNEFLTNYDLDFEILPIGDETIEWTYVMNVDMGGYAYMDVTCYDDASLEADYYNLLLTAGVDVTDDYYESYGYLVMTLDMEIEYCFSTVEGLFTLSIYGPYLSYEERGYYHSTTFPSNAITIYLKGLGFNISFPSLDKTADYYYKAWDSYFELAAEDKGRVGTNSLEDLLKKALEDNGWTVDDSYYEDEGYYAYYQELDLELMFYTFEEEFNLFVSSTVTSEGE